MGLIVCDKHVEQGIVHLCKHLHQAYQSEGYLAIEYQIRTDELGLTIFLCSSCIEEQNLTSRERMNLDELLEIVDDLWPVCCKCIAKAGH